MEQKTYKTVGTPTVTSKKVEKDHQYLLKLTLISKRKNRRMMIRLPL